MNPNTSIHETLHKTPFHFYSEGKNNNNNNVGRKREAHYKVNLAFN